MEIVQNRRENDDLNELCYFIKHLVTFSSELSKTNTILFKLSDKFFTEDFVTV